MAQSLKILQLLRNDPVYANREVALTAILSNTFLNNRHDGEIIIARYRIGNNDYGQLLGTIYVDSNNTKHLNLYENAAVLDNAFIEQSADMHEFYDTFGDDFRPISVSSAAKLAEETLNESLSRSSDLLNQLNTKQPALTAGNGINIKSDNTIEVTFSGNFLSVVDELPYAGESNKIYLLTGNSDGDKNIYTEYIWTNGAYEKLGEYTADIDLTPYIKKADLATSTGSSTTTSMTQKAITDALNGKQAKLTFDNTPAANSTNPVKSDGVFTAIANAKSDVLKNDVLDNSTTTKAPSVKLTCQVAHIVIDAIKDRFINSSDIIIDESSQVYQNTIIPGINLNTNAQLKFADNAIWDCGTYSI